MYQLPSTVYGGQMRIPSVYQQQALHFSSLVPQPVKALEALVSVRLGALGITYSTQKIPSQDRPLSQRASRPTTSFAQELSLALVRSFPQNSALSCPSSSSHQSSSLNPHQALQAYHLQAAYQARPAWSGFSASV